MCLMKLQKQTLQFYISHIVRRRNVLYTEQNFILVGVEVSVNPI